MLTDLDMFAEILRCNNLKLNIFEYYNIEMESSSDWDDVYYYQNVNIMTKPFKVNNRNNISSIIIRENIEAKLILTISMRDDHYQYYILNNEPEYKIWFYRSLDIIFVRFKFIHPIHNIYYNIKQMIWDNKIKHSPLQKINKLNNICWELLNKYDTEEYERFKLL